MDVRFQDRHQGSPTRLFRPIPDAACFAVADGPPVLFPFPRRDSAQALIRQPQNPRRTRVLLMQPLQFRLEMIQFFIRCHNFPFMVLGPGAQFVSDYGTKLRGTHSHPGTTPRRQVCRAGPSETFYRLVSCSPVVPADAAQQVGLIASRANTAPAKLWTNWQVVEFGVPKITLSPFQSGRHGRWLAAEMYADQSTLVQGVA